MNAGCSRQGWSQLIRSLGSFVSFTIEIVTMARLLFLAFLFCLTNLPDVRAAEQAPNSGTRAPAPVLKVLFLGDRGHHQPADRAAQLSPVLAGRGIQLVYTENLGDLNRETLAQYDALLIYANIEAISPEQEQALLQYVEGGGGFVPVHCAS